MMNKITQDSLAVMNRKSSFDSAGSASDSSSEEEVKMPPRGRIAIAKNKTTPAVRAQPGPIGKTKCRQCTKAVQGFRCSAGQQHVLCFQCKQAMPQRPDTVQSCVGCQRFYCNMYWTTAPQCSQGVTHMQLMQVLAYLRTTFASMPPTALNENQYEQSVLLDFMQSKAISFNDVVDAVLADMSANRWAPRLCNF